MACTSAPMMNRIEEMPRWSNNQSSYKAAPVGGHHNTSGSYGEWGSAQWGGENTRKNRRSFKTQHQHSRRSSHEAGWSVDHKQANSRAVNGGWNQPPAPPPPPQHQAEAGFAANFQEPRGPIPVMLANLPPSLCRQNFLEAILDQAGLADEVLGCVLGDARETGMAQITVTTWSAAVRCVAHFDGRSWDQAGNPVRATVSEEYLPQPIPQNESPKAATARPRKTRTSRSSSDSWKMDALVLPPSPQAAMPCPLPVDMSAVSAVDMSAGAWMMPAPMPMVDGCYKATEYMPDFKPRWADVVEEPVRFDDTEHMEKGSTSAGSSGRGSRDTNGNSFDSLPDDFACDTDDGF